MQLPNYNVVYEIHVERCYYNKKIIHSEVDNFGFTAKKTNVINNSNENN